MVATTSFPYSSIVQVTDTIGGSDWEGSGVLLSADEVLTAAHVVWTTGVGVATNVKVSPGYNNGAALLGTSSGTVAHYEPINDAGDSITLSQTANDFAIIHLTTPVPSSVGVMTLGADFSGGAVTVSGYPGYSGMQFDNAESVITTSNNVLMGADLGEGSSGGPVWTGGAANPTVVGLVSSGSYFGTTGYFNKITASERATIQAWVAQDDASAVATSPVTAPAMTPASTPPASTPPVAGWIDAGTGSQGTTAMTEASGGPSYLQWQYIWSGSDGVALSTTAPNAFLHGGTGQDSIQVSSGQNVLDGGAGSNFLTGGTGTDTFFTDARGSAVVWNTMRNFHAGDAATLWGFMPGVSSYAWDTSVDGATGSTGATLRANIVGGAGRTGNGIDASITFAGLSVAQAKSLQITTGTQAAGSYLFLYNPGV